MQLLEQHEWLDSSLKNRLLLKLIRRQLSREQRAKVVKLARQRLGALVTTDPAMLERLRRRPTTATMRWVCEANPELKDVLWPLCQPAVDHSAEQAAVALASYLKSDEPLIVFVNIVMEV